MDLSENRKFIVDQNLAMLHQVIQPMKKLRFLPLLFLAPSFLFAQEILDVTSVKALNKIKGEVPPNSIDYVHSFKNGFKVARIFPDSIPNPDLAGAYVHPGSFRIRKEFPRGTTRINDVIEGHYFQYNRCAYDKSHGYVLINPKGNKALTGLSQIIPLSTDEMLVFSSDGVLRVNSKLKTLKEYFFRNAIATEKFILAETEEGIFQQYDRSMKLINEFLGEQIGIVYGGSFKKHPLDAWGGWDKRGKELQKLVDDVDEWANDDQWDADDNWGDDWEDESAPPTSRVSTAVAGILVIQKEGELQFLDAKTLKPLTESFKRSSMSSIPYNGLRNKDIVVIQSKDGYYGLLKNDEDAKFYHPIQFGSVRYGYKYISIIKGENKGAISYSTWAMVPAEYKSIQLFKRFAICKTPSNKPVVVDFDSGKEILNQYNKIGTLKYSHDSCFYFIENGKYGIFNPYENAVTTAPTIDTILNKFYAQKFKPYKIGEKLGLININTGKVHEKPIFDKVISGAGDKISVVINGKNAFYNVATKETVIRKDVSEVFDVKWRQNVGFGSYRNNILFSSGKIIVGSNGTSRDATNDTKDGVYILDAKSGKIIKQIKNTKKGDNDVTGVALDGNKLFFGNDNYEFFCYTVSGRLLWKYKTLYDSESCPALADLNGDGVKDVVFATEAYGITALNGGTGKELWKVVHKEKNYGFMGAPAMYDVNNDGVKDVITGACGDAESLRSKRKGGIWVLNGKNGDVIWQKSMGSQVHSSPVVVTVEGKKLIAIAESYVTLNFYTLEGELAQIISFQHGLFSTPSFSKDGKYVYIGGSWWDDNDAFYSAKVNEGNWGTRYDAPSKKYDGGKTITKPLTASAAVADILSENPGMEVIVPSEKGELFILDTEGNEIMNLPIPSGAETTPFVGDIDGDGFLELIIHDTEGNITCYSTTSKGEVYIGQFRFGNDNSGVLK